MTYNSTAAIVCGLTVWMGTQAGSYLIDFDNFYADAKTKVLTTMPVLKILF